MYREFSLVRPFQWMLWKVWNSPYDQLEFNALENLISRSTNFFVEEKSMALEYQSVVYETFYIT